jgi:5-methylcytosine-specific restriction endonuclease McrA
MRWKPRNLAKNKDRKQFKVGNRDIWHYTCAICGPDKWYRDKEIRLDHIQPVVDPIIGYVDMDTYIDRMLCEEDGFQRLCDPCHDKKTEQEQQLRQLIKGSEPVKKKRKSKKKA